LSAAALPSEIKLPFRVAEPVEIEVALRVLTSGRTIPGPGVVKVILSPSAAPCIPPSAKARKRYPVKGDKPLTWKLKGPAATIVWTAVILSASEDTGLYSKETPTLPAVPREVRVPFKVTESQPIEVGAKVAAEGGMAPVVKVASSPIELPS